MLFIANPIVTEVNTLYGSIYVIISGYTKHPAKSIIAYIYE